MKEVTKKVTFKHVFAGSMVVYFGIIIYTLAFKEIPEGNREIFVHLLGILEGVVVTIGGYYYGSSSGSKAKSEVLEDALKTEQNK